MPHIVIGEPGTLFLRLLQIDLDLGQLFEQALGELEDQVSGITANRKKLAVMGAGVQFQPRTTRSPAIRLKDALQHLEKLVIPGIRAEITLGDCGQRGHQTGNTYGQEFAEHGKMIIPLPSGQCYSPQTFGETATLLGDHRQPADIVLQMVLQRRHQQALSESTLKGRRRPGTGEYLGVGVPQLGRYKAINIAGVHPHHRLYIAAHLGVLQLPEGHRSQLVVPDHHTQLGPVATDEMRHTHHVREEEFTAEPLAADGALPHSLDLVAANMDVRESDGCGGWSCRRGGRLTQALQVELNHLGEHLLQQCHTLRLAGADRLRTVCQFTELLESGELQDKLHMSKSLNERHYTQAMDGGSLQEVLQSPN